MCFTRERENRTVYPRQSRQLYRPFATQLFEVRGTWALTNSCSRLLLSIIISPHFYRCRCQIYVRLILVRTAGRTEWCPVWILLGALVSARQQRRPTARKKLVIIALQASVRARPFEGSARCAECQRKSIEQQIIVRLQSRGMLLPILHLFLKDMELAPCTIHFEYVPDALLWFNKRSLFFVLPVHRPRSS